MRRPVLTYSLLALAAAAATTGFVAHRFLDRPGVTALAWVPANATAAVAVDLVPAPDQILAFKSIEELMAKAPGDAPDKDALIGSLLHMSIHDDALAPIAKQVDRSIALAMLPKAGKPPEDGEGVALMPIKDATAVQGFLASKGVPETVNGVRLVKIKTSKETVHLFLKDSVLVAATEAWPVAAVAQVAMGKAPSLADVPGVAAARDKGLTNANLLVLASPALSRGNDWLVGSLKIYDTGLEISMDGRTDDKDFLKAGSLKSLDQRLLDALPRGAYGFFAVAQPGPAVALAGDKLDDPAKEMKKETDLDLRGDILPALGGNVAVGYYPSYGSDAGLDLLVSVDDANGADPATLARKLEKAIGNQIEKEGHEKDPWMVAMPVEGADASRLADEPTAEMNKEIQKAEKSFFRPLTLSRGKTVAWATVGNSVLMATSTDLLNRAIVARRNPGPSLGLSGDTALGASPANAADGQFAMAFSMRKFAEGIRNTVDPSHMSLDTAKIYRQILSLYDNTTEPLAFRAKIEPDGRYHGYFSVPIDWSKLPGFMK